MRCFVIALACIFPVVAADQVDLSAYVFSSFAAVQSEFMAGLAEA